jgi:hypothetical protein
MNHMGRAALVAAAAGLCLASAPARAESCWAKEEIAAAKVRELQTMLMVGALRCRASGIDILPSYNRFVSVNRSTITAMNDRLKVHFRSSGTAEGQRRYDRFTTALANGYGAGSTGPESCAEMADLSDEAASASGSAALIAIADRAIPTPQLQGASCPMTFAEAGR